MVSDFAAYVDLIQGCFEQNFQQQVAPSNEVLCIGSCKSNVFIVNFWFQRAYIWESFGE